MAVDPVTVVALLKIGMSGAASLGQAIRKAREESVITEEEAHAALNAAAEEGQRAHEAFMAEIARLKGTP